MTLRASCLILAFIALGACAPRDSVVFVTKTSLAILDADSKPPGLSIAYDRVEGYLGPREENGGAPPVFASIESDGKLFEPKISQIYATGDAARAAAGIKPHKDQELAGKPEKRALMFFGTSTTTGLKIGAATGTPDSFVFGYKRKEFSVIPLGQQDAKGADGKPIYESDGTTPKKVNVYPSAFASIVTEGKRPTLEGVTASLTNNQVFATGEAATAIAAETSDIFLARTRSALDAYQVSNILSCYAGLGPDAKRLMWEDADTRGLFNDGTSHEILTALKSTYTGQGDAARNAATLAHADQIYAKSIQINAAFSNAPDQQKAAQRSVQMSGHAAYVCNVVSFVRAGK